MCEEEASMPGAVDVGSTLNSTSLLTGLEVIYFWCIDSMPLRSSEDLNVEIKRRTLDPLRCAFSSQVYWTGCTISHHFSLFSAL